MKETMRPNVRIKFFLFFINKLDTVILIYINTRSHSIKNIYSDALNLSFIYKIV
jgi:hypothetical protein